jgi:hypothetical protein
LVPFTVSTITGLASNSACSKSRVNLAFDPC